MVDDNAASVADDRPQTVADLLDLIARERGALEQAVASMSDDSLAYMPGGWSAKDHLAHVAAWERRLVGELRGDREPPVTVRAEFQDSGEALRAAIAALSDADLQQPVRPDDPGVDTLLELIAWDTYRHYPEHVAAVTGDV